MSTPTPLEALRLHGEGLTQKAIGVQLGRSPSWVSWAVEEAQGRGAPRGRTAGGREAYLVRRGVIP